MKKKIKEISNFLYPSGILLILLILIVPSVLATEYAFDDSDYDDYFCIYNVSCLTGINSTFDKYDGNFSGTLSGTFIHGLNESNHTGNLSANRIVKDTGTNFLGQLLDIILDFLNARDDAINTTSNIEGLINDTIDAKVSHLNDTYILWGNNSGDISPKYDQDINLKEKNLNNASNITVTDRVNYGDSDHFIKKDYEFIDTIASASIDTVHIEVHPQGTIVTCTIYAPNDNLTDLRIVECTQVGRNNSYSPRGNSQGLIRNDICQLDRFNNGTHCNMTAVSDYTIMCNEFNKTEDFDSPCQFFADTRGRGGPLLWTQGDLEVWRTANIMEGLRVRLMADFIDTDVDILNGSFHSQIPVICNLGTTIGTERNLINERFLGSLGVFDNLQVDSGDWHSKPDARCDSDECANANGLSQTGNLIMQTNFSTLNFNQTGVSFVYSLTKLIAANSFSVTINNNVGSGDITLLTDSTDDVLLSSQYFAFPNGFSNVTKVSLNFECDVTKSDRLCFVDTVIVNGSSTADTTFNESRIASETCFDTGERGPDGRCIFGDYWEPCNQTLVRRGNVTEKNIVVETETVIGDLSAGSLTLDSESVFNWDNLTNFVQGIWNWTLGSNDIFYNKGNVCIGCTTPSSELHVIGRINSTNITTENIAMPDNTVLSWNSTMNTTTNVLSFTWIIKSGRVD